MIECSECGKKFRPLTDAYRCPCCGESNYPDDDFDDPPPRVGGVFTNCNVCGIDLRTFAEEEMGMCDRCADE